MKRMTALFMILSVFVTLFSGCSISGETKTTGHVNESEGRYSIFLPLCGQTVEMDERYEKYLPYITEELISAADTALSKVKTEYPDDFHSVYLLPDVDDYLCLCTEIIVDLEPPEEGMKGCGIDHDHVFYRERISTEALE